MKPFFRKLHRWLGLLMALQIIAWMVSGLYFSIFPIEVIRGEHLTKKVSKLTTAGLEGLITPDAAWSVISESQMNEVSPEQIGLISAMDQTWYRVTAKGPEMSFTRLVNARTGELLDFLDKEDVRKIARQRLIGEGVMSGIELVESAEPDSEIRGRQLPIWKVSFSEPENLSLYIDGWTGDLVTRRTTRWRIFDFLWMLHIMDFDERDDFNTPLLQIAAALGLLVALSGVIFWAMTTRVFRSRRKTAM
jgi:uncharacterized iron-regulated membrane protein